MGDLLPPVAVAGGHHAAPVRPCWRGMMRDAGGVVQTLYPGSITDHDAALDALGAQLEATRFLIVTTLLDGSTEYQLTPDGGRVARQLAMLGEDGQDELLGALLGAGEAEE